MYQLGVRKNFIAQHFLIGGDWGAENHPHSHAYVLEVVCDAKKTDQHNYLIDIVDLEKAIGEIVHRFAEHQLNDFPEFHKTNPSLELFAKVIYLGLKPTLIRLKAESFKVVLWENEFCWASYTEEKLA